MTPLPDGFENKPIGDDKDDTQETPPYRMITTFNAQLTKWTFLLCGVAIGFLICKVYFSTPTLKIEVQHSSVNQQEEVK